MKLAPLQWRGQAQQFIQDVLRPNFLAPQHVQVWHEFLIGKMNEAQPQYMIEALTPEQKSKWGHEKTFVNDHGNRITFGDLAPAVALFTYLQDRPTFKLENAAGLYLHLPFHVFDLDRFTKWAGLTNNAASAGWMTSLLFEEEKMQNWEKATGEDLMLKTFRYLHPLSYFLFPNLNKSGAMYKSDQRLSTLMAAAYEKFYGEIWHDYIVLTKRDLSVLPLGQDFPLEYDSKVTANITHGHTTSREPIQRIEAADAVDLKLMTLAENQGHQSRPIDTGLMTRGFVDLKVEVKKTSGDHHLVGYFRFNLKDLFDKKLIARDKDAFRLTLHLMTAEPVTIHLGPRKNGPMMSLPIK